MSERAVSVAHCEEMLPGLVVDVGGDDEVVLIDLA